MESEAILTETAGSKDAIGASYSIKHMAGALFFESELTKFGQDLKGLIYSKWLRSYRYGNEQAKLIPPDLYWPHFQQMVRRVLINPACQVKFATLDDDEDVVLGFVIHRNEVLDYVYVHKDVRRQGIARKLIPAGIKEFTHLTKLGAIIYTHKCKSWRFNPFV